MKIVRIIGRLNVGGPAIHAILMTDAFRQRGYPTLLITGETAAGEESMDCRAEEKGVHPIKIATMSRKISYLKDLWALWKLIRILRREKPAIVHTHTAKAGTLGRIAAIVTGVPIRVHTFHGHVFHSYFSPFRTRMFIAIERFLARYTHCILAVSESQRRELVERYRIAPPDRVTTVPVGFELDEFLNVNGYQGFVRSKLNCPPDAGLVGWVGRLTPVKDPWLFADSASVVHAQLPQTKFVVVGDGELRKPLEYKLEHSGLSAAFTILGVQRSMAKVYADLDLIVLTSKNEGTPLVLLEAMAAGKPFVATDVGGVRDLMVGAERPISGFRVFENGILTDRTEASIGEAILYVLRNPERLAQMGSVGRKHVAARYSHRRLADDLEKLYLALVNGSTVKCRELIFREHPANPAKLSLKETKQDPSTNLRD